MISRLQVRSRPGRPTRTGRPGGSGGASAAPAELVSYEYTDLANSGTTINIPAHESGDIGLCILYRDSSIPTTPAGWTSVGGRVLVSVAMDISWKELNGVETTLTAGSSVFQAAVAVFRNVSEFQPSPDAQASGGTGTSWDAPAGYATSPALDVVILGIGDDIANPGGPSGFTLAGWNSNISGSDESIGCWYKVSDGSQYAGETDVAALVDNWGAVTVTGIA